MTTAADDKDKDKPARKAKPDADAPAKVDAILFRTGWRPPGADPHAPNDAVQLKFGLDTIGRRCRIALAPGIGQNLCFMFPDLPAGEPQPSYLYPTGHRFEKQERYDWAEQEDGSRFGTLKPEPE